MNIWYWNLQGQYHIQVIKILPKEAEVIVFYINAYIKKIVQEILIW